MNQNPDISREVLDEIGVKLLFPQMLDNPLHEVVEQLWDKVSAALQGQPTDTVIHRLAGLLRQAKLRASEAQVRQAVQRVAQIKGDVAIIIKVNEVAAAVSAITEGQVNAVQAAIENIEAPKPPVEQLVERAWDSLRMRLKAGLRLRELVVGMLPAVEAAGIPVKPATLRAAIRAVARRRQDQEVLDRLGISPEPDGTRYRGGGRKAKKRPAPGVPTATTRRVVGMKPGEDVAGNGAAIQPMSGVPTAR